MEVLHNSTYASDLNLTSTTIDERLMCNDFVHITDIVQTYITPAIVVFGLIGNLLAAIVFLSTKLKKRSSSIYLGTLSLADFGFLFVVLVGYLSYANVLDFYNVNVVCQLMVFVSSTCSNVSVWTIVAFTTERFIAVKYPLKRPQICTVSRAKTVTVCILAVALMSQTYVFWAAGITSYAGEIGECEMLPEYREFMKVVNAIDTLFALVIPLSVILVLNTMIARSLIVFREKLFVAQEESSSNVSFVGYSEDGIYITLSSMECSGRMSANNSNINIVRYERNLLSAKNQRHITKTLLLISTVFILLNVPSYVLRLYTFTLESVLERPVPSTVWCMQQFAITLFYTNYSINFLLYSMYGATFRQTLIVFLLSKVQRVGKLLWLLKRKLH